MIHRPDSDGKSYDLVCGQGRVQACNALGVKEVAAFIIKASREELFLMSLAENLARRQRTSLDMAREILAMKERGQAIPDIARKVDLHPTYVLGIIRLLKQGEERLLVAVERRQIPLTLAIAIAKSSDQEVQKVLQEVYEKGELKGKAFAAARRLVESRLARGKKSRDQAQPAEGMTAESLMAIYRKETARQELLVSQATVTDGRLRFIVAAFKKLLADENFINVLRAESLVSMPQFLADMIHDQGVRDAS